MSKAFIIAEAGVNHNGDFALAKKLIDIAADAGADAVKFQTWKTELLVTPQAKQANYQTSNTGLVESQYEMLKRLELSYDDFVQLKNYCDDKKIIFMSTADEIPSAIFLATLQDIFKIGSGEITNIPYLRCIGGLAKQVIISTGMADLSEIEFALNVLIGAGVPRERITVLHATTEYPCPVGEVNLNAMMTIRNAFKVNVGYSDHTRGINVPIAAIALGATVIEKHFTLDVNLPGPDHKASLMPSELREMILSIREIELAMGDGVKRPTSSELNNKPIVRKSIVATTPIAKGDIFSERNIAIKRPGNGISPIFWDEVIGRVAARDFSVDELIKL